MSKREGSNKAPSTSTAPNSLITNAIGRFSKDSSQRFKNVVLPEPKKPVTMYRFLALSTVEHLVYAFEQLRPSRDNGGKLQFSVNIDGGELLYAHLFDS